MKLEELPLLDIFNSLRQRHGLPLGVEEYLAVVRSLEAGFGVANREQLEQLCCMLWAKSEQENRLIQKLFGEMWIQIESLPINSDSSAQGNSPTSLNETESDADTSSLISDSPTLENYESSSIETLTPEESQVDEPLPDLDIPPTITPEPVQAVQAVRSSRSDREIQRPRYVLLTEYFPVTKRQMKQCWRYLRRPIRQGIPTELDVEATVAKIGREGILLQPVLTPPRKNRSDLVLLIDQEGSMVPFHELSRQLAETAQRGGRLRTTNVFYFHDYPDEYLYRHPAMLDAKPVSGFLEQISERAAVLIVSDAGAARGNFDQERVDNTKVWIEQLQQSVRYFAWLNPMPSECWRQTTAGEIARFVSMFEMSSQGMNAAISVLRGSIYCWRGDLLMADVTTDVNQSRAMRIARRRVEGFAEQFGEAHRNLARHAAFPLVLTPDLLYQIWANFVPEAPWVAVAHVLLSRLCRQVGYEIYEIDIADRNLLLRELKGEFEQERFDELGKFLLDYVAQRLTDDDGDTRDLREAQEWTALTYTKPDEAARELAQRLSESVKEDDVGEVLRLASLVETFAEPLKEAGFELLLVYTHGVSSLIRSHHVDAEAQLASLEGQGHDVQVAGVELPNLFSNKEYKVFNEDKNEWLRQLIIEACKQPQLSVERRKAMNLLFAKILRLPGLMKSSHPDYDSALQQTWLWVVQNIEKFNISTTSVQKDLMQWINSYLVHQIRKLYFKNSYTALSLNKLLIDDYGEISNTEDNHTNLSLDEILEDTFFDWQGEELTYSDILEDYYEQENYENQELRNLFQQLEYYIDCDPEARLRNCHLQKHPECNCQLLAQRRLLKDPPNTLTNIAQDLNLTSAQVARHWSKCKNILQEIVKNIGYLPE